MNQNHCVPNYREVEDDFCIPTSSGLSRPNIGGEEEIMELLWQNGQVVAQTQKLPRKSLLGFGCDAVIPPEQRDFRPRGCEETAAQQQHLFIQEDEMASWLHYPIDVSSIHRDMYADLVYSSAHPTPSAPVSAPPRPASGIRPSPAPQNLHRLQNFLNTSRIPARVGQSLSSLAAARESTVVESNETPAIAGMWSRVSHAAEDRKVNIPVGNVRSSTAVETSELVPAVSSSPSCSVASFSTSADRRPPQQKPTSPASAAVDRKRKSREIDDNDGQNTDIINLGGSDAKKQGRDSSSSKKSRAAEVHNLSERRRRDRINEKMKALQDLIPRCNKSDKASMLDEAIEYLKSLQLQVQMMSMGCGMVPMMYPSSMQQQQYHQFMPMMGMGMGMGMGMDMNMPRPMVSYPSMMPGPALPNPAQAARLSPCFPLPQFHNQPPRMPNFNANQCQQLFSLNVQAQPPLLPQNQAVGQRVISEAGNPENRQDGRMS